MPESKTAVMLEGESTLKEIAGVPPKVTAETPIKLVPAIVIIVPFCPYFGEKEIIEGTGGIGLG